MAYKKSRQELRERAKREAHRSQDTGAFDDESWNRSLAEGWEYAWHLLVYSDDDNIGRARRKYTITTASELLALPDSFSELQSFARLRGQCVINPMRTTAQEAERRGYLDGQAPSVERAAYWIEGPGTEWSEALAADVSYDQRIRTLPLFAVGEEVRIGYTTQAPTLGDPADSADDAVIIDLVWEPIARLVTSYARAVAAEREDPKDLARAQKNLAEGVADLIASRSRRNNAQAFAVDAFSGGGPY